MTLRISSIEEDIKGMTSLLREAQEMQELEQCVQHMLAELEESRRSRKKFEEHAQLLKALLVQERSKTETWLVVLKSEMQQTLRELEGSVTRSIQESGKLMQGRLDEADSTMVRLLARVNKIFGPSATDAGRASAAQDDAAPITNGAAALDNTTPATNPASWVAQREAQPIAARTARAARATTCSPPASSRTPQIGPPAAPGSTTLPCGSAPAAPFERARSADVVGIDGATGATGAEILRSWTELLNENLRLQQRNTELVSRKQRMASGRVARSSTGSPHRTAPNLSPLSRSLPHSHTTTPLCRTQGTKPRLPILQEL